MGKQNVPIDASAVTPREVVDAFQGHPGYIRSEIILNHFLRLGIYASGRIVSEDKIGFGLDYVTAGIEDHGVLVLCNFDKPVTPNVAALKKGEQIRVHGIVENANKDIVVLASCRLEKRDLEG